MEQYLRETQMLDYSNKSIQELIEKKGWRNLDEYQRLKAIYNYVRQEMFEKYLEEKYPDKTFTVKVWQEYAKETGPAGLPDYEGYLFRQVVIDSEGNCFMVFPGDDGKCTDDYQKVLDGWVHYNEKGQRVVYDDDGNIVTEDY